MNLDFISIPVGVKAIQFAKDGSNWQEVVNTIALYGGYAELVYLDAHGHPKPKHVITEHKGIVLAQKGSAPIVCPQGYFIILNGDEMYPIPEEDFNTYHIPMENINDMGNGQHTFKELYKELSRFEPTLEQILVADKYRENDPIVIDFIKRSATVHTDSDGTNYYVLHGKVYVFKGN